VLFTVNANRAIWVIEQFHQEDRNRMRADCTRRNRKDKNSAPVLVRMGKCAAPLLDGVRVQSGGGAQMHLAQYGFLLWFDTPPPDRSISVGKKPFCQGGPRGRGGFSVGCCNRFVGYFSFPNDHWRRIGGRVTTADAAIDSLAITDQ